MAHAAKLSSLTDGLFWSVAGDRSQHASFRRMRDQAAKTFRNPTHARTNQFDVQSKLAGLVEKFEVLNKDELSYALQNRLNELQLDSKWMPEILSLLLQLSDRPLENTNLRDVDILSTRPEEKYVTLTFNDLVADRAGDEAGLWDDVERGYHSSGDEAYIDEEADSDATEWTKATSAEDDTAVLARLEVSIPYDYALNIFPPNDPEKDILVSELMLIRETLFMLRGLGSFIYTIRTEDGSIGFNLRLETATRATMIDILIDLTATGSALNSLRLWARSPQKMAYIESCQALTLKLLTKFDRQISLIERRYVAARRDVVVSIIAVQSEVNLAAEPFMRLSRIVSASNDAKSSPFALLDALYAEISIAEMSCEDTIFRALVQVFLPGLKTYLRPLSTWIQTGSFHGRDTAFMVQEADPDCDRGRLWHDRLSLRRLADDTICCPKFMRGMANKIFTTGKGRAFLAALGDEDEVESDLQGSVASTIDSLRNRLEELQLLPFSQLLDEALEHWIVDTSRDSSSLLNHKLLHDCGLLHTVDRLESVFCSRDGVLFQTFAGTLFSRMDHQPNGWKHEFLLSELASSTFGDSNGMDSESLSVNIEEDVQSTRSNSSIRQLVLIQLKTTFPWPVQNITLAPTSDAHSKAFSFLLQTYRAKYVLQPQALDLKRFPLGTSGAISTLHPALLVRQRLLSFVDIVHNHITTTAQILHKTLRIDLAAANDIDAMAAVWAAYVKYMQTTLLLAQKFNPLREAIVGCLEMCEQFAKFWRRTVRSHSLTEESAEAIPSRGEFADMRRELNKSVSFIAAGVRSVGRASGDKMLEELAERLEWMAPT